MSQSVTLVRVMLMRMGNEGDKGYKRSGNNNDKFDKNQWQQYETKGNTN